MYCTVKIVALKCIYTVVQSVVYAVHLQLGYVLYYADCIYRLQLQIAATDCSFIVLRPSTCAVHLQLSYVLYCIRRNFGELLHILRSATYVV